MKQMMKMMALGASVSALAALVGCSQVGPMATAGEFEVEGKVYGMPKAEVFREDYRGDAVVGDTMTASPHLAKLDYAGNKTHQVRLDTLSQKVEVAPGVSYTAWTFGGSVPGPVLHVREGDRVVFTMKNRSDEAVLVSEPGKGAAPFYRQMADNPYQKPEAAISPMPHSMDFHSGTVAADDKWRSISPGLHVPLRDLQCVDAHRHGAVRRGGGFPQRGLPHGSRSRIRDYPVRVLSAAGGRVLYL